MIGGAKNEMPFRPKYLGCKTRKRTREEKMLNDLCRNDSVETAATQNHRVIINTQNVKLKMRVGVRRQLNTLLAWVATHHFESCFR